MKIILNLFKSATLALFAAMMACGCGTKAEGTLTLDNGLMRIQLDRKDGTLRSMTADGQEMMCPQDGSARKPLWHLLDVSGKAVEDTSGIQFSIRKKWFIRQAASLTWKLADGTTLDALVRLGRKEALSYWSIKVGGVAGKGVVSVRFPIIEGFARLDEERLAVSTWQGSLYKDPRSVLSDKRPSRTFSWSSPDRLTMQLVALYSENQSSPGLYFSSNDNEAMSKNYRMVLDRETTAVEMDMEFPEDDTLDTLDPGFETVVGAFRGDWHEAAAIYRRWAVEQPWARNSRFHNNLTPEWAQNTAV